MFIQKDADYICEKYEQGCDAFKTTVYMDAYIIKDGEEILLKENIARTVSDVYSQSKSDNIIKCEQLLSKCPKEFSIEDVNYAINQVQSDQTEIKQGGVRLKVFYDIVIDKAKYKVEHYKETAPESGEYELSDTENGEYAIGENFEAIFKNYSGFRPLETSVRNIIISEDSSANIIKLYYNMRQIPFQDEFSFWVPKNIYVNIDKDGNAEVQGNPVAINAAQKRSVAVKNVILRAVDGWSFANDVEELKSEEAGSKKILVNINGDKAINSDDCTQIELSPERWIIAADTALALNIGLTAAKQVSNINQVHAFSIDFIADWSEADPPELTEHRITLIDSVNGKIDENANKEFFSINEQVPELPKCEADYFYKHTGWKITGTETNIRIGDLITSDVILEPVYEQRGEIIDAIFVDTCDIQLGYIKALPKFITGDTVCVPVISGDTWGQVRAEYDIDAVITGDSVQFRGWTTSGVVGYINDDFIIDTYVNIMARFEDPNVQYVVNILPPDAHGVIENDTVKMSTDRGGVISPFPNVIADKCWEVDRWVNTATGDTVNVGDIINKNITIKPVMKLKDNVVTIKMDADFYANLTSYSSVYAEVGQTWGEIIKPVASPVSGYQLMGWYNGDMPLTDDYVITSGFTAKMKAAKDMSSYFYFSDNVDGTVTLTGWKRSLSEQAKNGVINELALPSSYNGKPVTVIKRGFNGSSGYHIKPSSTGFSINNVIIPSSVKDIKEEAFAYNDMVKNYVFFEGLEVIGDNAFAENTAITSVSLPTTVINTGRGAFEDCTAISDVYVPAMVLNNAEGAQLFWDCTNVRSWSAPEGTVRLPSGLFGGCTYLSNVDLTDTITVIEDSVFSGCSRLSAIVLPEGLTDLGSMALSSTALKEIRVPAGVKMLDSTFSYCTSLKTVVLEGVETIGSSTFLNCTGLQAGVSIPTTTKLIKNSAFSGCSNIFLEVPDTVETIEQMAFGNAYHIYYYGKAADLANDNWGAKYRN